MSNGIQSAGAKLRRAIEQENPLQIVGTINAYTAMMAEKVGHKALYLSGAGVANASFGLPDLSGCVIRTVFFARFISCKVKFIGI